MGDILHTINTFGMWFALWLLAINLWIIVFNGCVPNIRTAPAIRKRIIELIREDMKRNTQRPYTIVDIGAGYGQFTREMARALPDAQVIGLEISKPTFLWCMWVKKRYKLDNLDYRHVDFFKYDMAGTSAVTLFFYRLDPVAKKLRRELKPGSFVASNKFHLLDNWVPKEVIDVKTRYWWQKRLFVYASPGMDDPGIDTPIPPAALLPRGAAGR